MKIIKLTAENFKRLEAVEIEPSGNTIWITGKNSHGKTSVLDAIVAALQYPGQKQLPKPIREGSDKAEIKIDLGDLVVSRIFTEKTNRLEVTNKANMKFSSPQEVLNKLIGKFTFDPTDFYHMEDKEQKDFLMDAMGLGDKLAKLDTKRKILYDQRTFLNRHLKTKQANLPSQGPDKVEPVSITEISQRYQDASKRMSKILNMKNKINMLKQQHKVILDQITNLKSDLAQNEETRNNLSEELSKTEPVNLQAIENELNGAEEINRKAESWNRFQETTKEAKELGQKRDKLTYSIEDIDRAKEVLLRNTNFPINGLAFTDEGVIYQNIPFKQASDAEQIRVSMAIAMALNPKLRIIRINNGSLLDSKNRLLIEGLADKNDYQVWIESVDESGKVGIVIEEGKIKNAKK